MIREALEKSRAFQLLIFLRQLVTQGPSNGQWPRNVQVISQCLLLFVLMLSLPSNVFANNYDQNYYNNTNNHDLMTNIQNCMIAFSNNHLSTPSQQNPLTRLKAPFAIIQSISSQSPPLDFDSASAIMR